MNPVAQSSPSFAILFLFLFLLLFIPGTILGWIAAGRIRHSGGQLYGLRLAAFAGMTFPTFLLVALFFFFVAFFARAGVFWFDFAKEDTLVFGGVVFASFGWLSYKVFGVGLRSILGREPVREPLTWRKCRVGLLVLFFLWIAASLLIFLQRPRELEDALASESPDGLYIVEGSTWRRMSIWGVDERFYRFVVKGRGGTVDQTYQVPVPYADLAKGVEGGNDQDYSFQANGSIKWTGEGRNISFLVDQFEVFTLSLDEVENSPGGLRVNVGRGSAVTAPLESN